MKSPSGMMLGARFGFATLALAILASACGPSDRDSDDSDDDDRGGGFGGMAGSAPQGGTGPTGGSGGGAGAETGGRAGMGGQAGTGGQAGVPVIGCEGFELTRSGILDLELRAVTVTGSVTLGGAPLPDETGSRGALVFQSADGRSSAHVELEATGARTYSLRLPPGAYDVSYSANSELCAWPDMPRVPCGSGRLVSGVALAMDGVLDIDIPVVSVSGNVMLEGGGFSETAKRGALSFSEAVTGSGGTVALPATGVASYRLNLLPGTYDVSFVGDPTECTGEMPPAVPCNSGVVRSGVALTSSGVLDLDVPAVRVSGVVTLNGSLPPTEASPRGQLAFASDEGGAALSKPFAPTGATSYEVLLVPGVYSVSYVPGTELCASPTVPAMPCVGGTVIPEQNLSMDGVLDVDVRAVTVTGQVTLNGATLPDEMADRGRLSFTNQVGGSGATRGFELTGPGTHTMRVLAGSYDIDFVANAELCAADTPPALPCTGGSVGRDVMMQADGVYDADLRRVEVAGVVNLNGAQMAPAEGDRGSLTFTGDGSSVKTAAFGPSGAVEYRISVWPGEYRVDFDANAALCGPGLAAPPVPCVGGTLVPAASLTNDGVLDLDVPSVAVSGNVTLNQMPLPTATAARGTLEVARAPDQGADTTSIELGTDSSPSYAVTLTAGRYVFFHAANPALCTAPEPPPLVPCVSQALVGCGMRAP